MRTITHKWNSEFCSCGQDTVTCQACGKRVCGTLTLFVPLLPGRSFGGNVCWICQPITRLAGYRIVAGQEEGA